jgi:hypothetical protein
MPEESKEDHSELPEQPESEEVVLDPDWPDDVKREVIKRQGLISMIGLIVGSVIAIAGVVLVVFGFSGDVEIAVEIGGVKSNVVTGSLGIVVLIAGLAIIYITRYSVKSGGGRSESGA